jgi:hypothetical protein
VKLQLPAAFAWFESPDQLALTVHVPLWLGLGVTESWNDPSLWGATEWWIA